VEAVVISFANVISGDDNRKKANKPRRNLNTESLKGLSPPQPRTESKGMCVPEDC
jgi:hypothetical protein